MISRMTARPFRSRSSGQSIVEFILVLPVILALFLGSLFLFTGAQRQTEYTRGAQTLAEWIARTGNYDAVKRDALIASLASQPLSDPAGAYLHIIVTAPQDWSSPSSDAAGGVALANIGEAPSDTAPGDTGWNSTTLLSGLPVGSTVTVQIWSTLDARPMSGIGFTAVPSGQSTFLVLNAGGTP
jgi:Flp pilus assembly protein TadG